MNKPLLICMMGLPRSGKTTIVKNLAQKIHAPVVNRDSIRLALTGQRYQIVSEHFVKAITEIMVRTLFLSGHNVIIYDETNWSRAARDTYKSDQWRTVFYEVDTPPDVCIERAKVTDQLDIIPVIQAMWERREPLGADEETFASYLAEGAIRDVSRILNSL